MKKKNNTLTNLYSLEAEQAVLGSLMLENQYWDDIVEQINFEDFHSQQHQIIFRAMASLINSNQPIDLITLSEYMGEQRLEQCGGFAYLAELAKNTPRATNYSAYTKIIAEFSQKRKLQALSENIKTKLSNNTEPLLITQLIEEQLHQISGNTIQTGYRNVYTILDNILVNLETASSAGVMSGIDRLDSITGGYQPSDLIIISGRPSMGKTALILSNLLHILQEYHQPVFFFSLEMSAEKILQRAIAILGGLSLNVLKAEYTPYRTDEDWGRISNALKILTEIKDLFIIDDSAYLTPSLVRSRIRRYIRQFGAPKIIAFDYLQMIRGPMRENRNLEVSEVSSGLKALAKEFNVPIVVLSQLNRAIELRPNKRPFNSDLRDSGSIEQDADLIIHLYRDEVYNPNTTDKGIAELIIGKQRNGPTGMVKATYIATQTRFTSLERGLEE